MFLNFQIKVINDIEQENFKNISVTSKTIMKNLLFILFTFFIGLNAKAINAPTLSSPANASSASVFTITLIANQVTGAAGYQFQLDTVNTFNSAGKWSDTATFRAIGSPALKTFKTYFWRVRCYAGLDTSIWSTVFSFNTTLGTTQIFSPTNNNSGPIVDLRANNLGSTPNVGYVFEVDTTASLNSGFKVLRVQGTNQFIDTNVFTYGRRVFWRARVFNSLGDTFAWSPIWSYTMHTAPVINGSPNVSIVDPQFYPSWASAGLSTIVLQVDTSPNFNTSKLEERNVVPGRTLDTLSNLFFGKDYFYRIKLKYGLSQTSWSVSRQIRVKSTIGSFSPGNGNIINGLTVSFNWTAMSGVRFQAELYNDSAQTQLLRDTLTSSNNFAANHPLQLNKWYRWRIRAFHAKDTLPWQIANFKTFTGMLNLGAPSSNATNVNVRPRFSFRKQTWGTSHVMEIDTGTSFGSTPSSYYIKVIDSFNFDGSFFHYIDTVLRYNQKYVWRVYAIKDGVEAEPTQRNFTTVAAPSNYFPQNNYIGIGTQTNALITGITGSKWVAWELDTTANFSSPHKFSGANAHKPDDFTPQYVEVIFPEDLRFHAKYYWRTRCINAIDTSQWSVPFNFTTTQDMFLTSPANGAVNQALSTKLEWSIQGSAQHLRYQYQVSIDSNFVASPVITLAASSSANTTVNGTYATTYFWRARAYNGIDTSRWSAISRFTTINPPVIGVPSLLSPASSAKNVPVAPITLAWSFASNALEYEAVVSDEPTFTNIIASGKTTGTGSIFSGVQPNTRYYWRVRGLNGTAVGPWSGGRWFETAPPVGIEEKIQVKGLMVYPNPAIDVVTIKADEDMLISILDIQGKTIWVQTEKTKETSINTAEWPNGMYIISIETEAGMSHQQLIVNH